MPPLPSWRICGWGLTFENSTVTDDVATLLKRMALCKGLGHALLRQPGVGLTSFVSVVPSRLSSLPHTLTYAQVFGLHCIHPNGQMTHRVQDSVVMVRDLFRDQNSTEFIIATIPTVLGVRESARLAAALRKENIACKRIIVNQVGRRSLATAFDQPPAFYSSTKEGSVLHTCFRLLGVTSHSTSHLMLVNQLLGLPAIPHTFFVP